MKGVFSIYKFSYKNGNYFTSKCENELQKHSLVPNTNEKVYKYKINDR